ncbi:unnamed protein product [Blepharisma stoltei]|uniref:Wntless-like transmembrane domain-containing protein n=1 Tax=Blepharisma stoltei TaxID=1481888 RepID=A0AAU9JU65_9CILI|nr:unnamed protein product [Blepharisma stoltei]
MEAEDFIKLRLEYLSKYKLILQISFFLFAFLGCIIASTMTPEMIHYSSVIIEECELGNESSDCFTETGAVQTWSGIITGATKFNQVLFLTATPETKKNVEFELDLRVILKGRTESDNTDYPVIDKRTAKKIDCSKGDCSSLLIFYEPYLDYTVYDLSVEVYSTINADDIKFDLGYISAKFTKFQLITKYLFLFFALSSLIYFIKQTIQVPSYLWSFDTKMVGVLGISLIIFDEPFLAFSIFFPSHYWSWTSAFCTTQFVGFFLYFWMVEFQSYKQFKHRWLYFIAEGIVVGAFFILLFVVYCYVHLQLKYDPAYDWENDLKTSYRNVFIAVIVLLGFIGLWIMYLCIRAIPVMRKFTTRKKFIIRMNLCMMVLAFIGIGMGAFQSIPRNGELMLVYVAALNLYIILLEWLFAPENRSLADYNKEQEYDYSILKLHQEEIEMTENSIQNN